MAETVVFIHGLYMVGLEFAPLRYRVGRAGFETRISVPAHGPYFRVQALDASGKVLRSSAVVHAIGVKV